MNPSFNQVALINQELVIQQLARLDEILMRFNHSVAEATPYSIAKFLNLPEVEQLRILDMIEKYITVLQPDPAYSTKSNVENEVLRLKNAARDFNMRILDDRVFACISNGDVVEIYDAQERQIYRNLLFCKLSSYSLLDVAVNTWDELYDRPAHSISGIRNKIIELFTTSVLTMPFEIESHILKEKFVYAKIRKTFLMNMKWMSPLEDLSSRRRSGAVVISQVDVVASAGQDDSITIL